MGLKGTSAVGSFSEGLSGALLFRERRKRDEERRRQLSLLDAILMGPEAERQGRALDPIGELAGQGLWP